MPTESSAAIVEFTDVTKHYRLQQVDTLKELLPAVFRGAGWSQPFYALRGVSFAVQPGETVGIIGRNGSGKSTLLKLVAGVTLPSQGRITVEGRVCPIIELGSGFHPDLSGSENVFLNATLLGLTDPEIRARFNDIVDFAELQAFMSTPVKRYSSGMYVRLGFAVAVFCEPDILIVDEALAVGDLKFQEKCIDKLCEMRARGVTILFVSHNVSLVRRFCSRVLLLDDGVLIEDGAPEKVTDRYYDLLALRGEQAGV